MGVEFALQTVQNFFNFKKGMVIKMNITEKQLREIVKGVVSLSQEDGWFRFSRFTEKQFGYYFEKTPDTLYPKTFATAGMYLECMTDASEISFDFRVFAASSRFFYSVDLYIDGVFCDEMYVMNYLRKKEGSVSFSLPEGAHRITVYFPNLMRMDIANLQFKDATFIQPIDTDMKILFLGDSITQGYDAYHSSLAYANLLGKALGAETLNQAVGGEIFDEKILDEALPFDPDMVLIAYGTNDWAVQPNYETFITAADTFLKKIKEIYPDKTLVYISPIWRGDSQKPFGTQEETPVGAFEDAVSALKALAKEIGFFVVDGFRLTPHISDFFADQFLHPNDLGFSIYAQNLLQALREGKLII